MATLGKATFQHTRTQSRSRVTPEVVASARPSDKKMADHNIAAAMAEQGFKATPFLFKCSLCC